MDAGGDDSIASRVYWSGVDKYEPATLDIFRSLLSTTRTFFDIGANTGLFTLLAAADRKREVHAFEPLPSIFARLRHNVDLNGFSNARLSPVAVGDRDGQITLYIPATTMFPTSASTREGFRTAYEQVEVSTITLDTHLRDSGTANLDLIKMDTEGTEHLVLAGAQVTLDRYEPVIICEVLSGRTEQQLTTMLEPAGYRYFWIADNGLVEHAYIKGDKTYQNTNYLFATPARLREMGHLVGIRD